MKKQFYLVLMIICFGICFNTVSKNNLKACGTSTAAAACKSINNKTKAKNIESEKIIEDIDASFNRLMNPITQL